MRWEPENLCVIKHANLWLWDWLGAAGEMLSLPNSSITSWQSFPAWVARGGSKRWGKVSWFIGGDYFVFSWGPIRSVLAHCGWHGSTIFWHQWPRCDELIAKQIWCCLREISWGFTGGRWWWWDAFYICFCRVGLDLGDECQLICRFTRGSLGSGNPVLCLPRKRQIRRCPVASLGLSRVKFACTSHFERIQANV